MFQFFVYTVWACLKAVTPYNTLKEESTNKNFYDDNYSASITRCTLLRFETLEIFKLLNIFKTSTYNWFS